MKVLVNFLTNALGDTIGGMPAVLAFQRRENCDVYVRCNWAKLVKKSYPSLIFVNSLDGDYDQKINVDYHFEYPLQEGFAKDLGFLNWTYVKPLIDFEPLDRPIKRKYITLGTHSTAQCKYWNYPDGWNILCKLIEKEKMATVCIDQHKIFGSGKTWNTVPKNSIKRLNNTIEETMNYIYHSEFFMGVSSGLSWVAHAMGKKVVMISGITQPWNEFDEDCLRIINQSVCHGCFHKTEKYKFDSQNWNWCPEYKDPKKQFECTKTITPGQVFKKIKEKNWL